MSELHTNLYIFCDGNTDVLRISGIFLNDSGSFQPLSNDIAEIMSENLSRLNIDGAAAHLVKLLNFVKSLDVSFRALVPESHHLEGNICQLHFVHGDYGIDLTEKIVDFFGSLGPDVDVRACLMGDDDPWEIFYRYENGKTESHFFMADENMIDDPVLPCVYQWWHKGLPVNVKEGFLNLWSSDDSECD